MGADRHLHATDAGSSGVFEVNTFQRALRRLRRPLEAVAPVIHLRRGRPALGLAIADEVDLVGRRRLDVIAPALGPDGPYVELVGVHADSVFPADGGETPQGRAFLRALAAYRDDPSDENWDRANDALAAWGEALERWPVPRPRAASI